MAQDAAAVRDKEIQALTDLTQKMREQRVFAKSLTFLFTPP